MDSHRAGARARSTSRYRLRPGLFGLVFLCGAVCLLIATAVAAAELPDGRRYELVSPSEKYSDVGSSESLIAPFLLADGEHVLYPATVALPGSENGQRNDYIAGRSASGWSSEPLLPASSSDLFQARGLMGQWFGISDGGRSILYQGTEPLDSEDQDEGPFGPGADLYLRRPDGTFAWVTRNPLHPNDPNDTFYYGVLSGDGSHVVFSSIEPLVPEDEARAGGSGLYDWHDGQLNLVAVDNEGTLLGSGMAELGMPSSSPPEGIGLYPVSKDGSRIFFFLEGHAYVRENDAITRALGNPSDSSGLDVVVGATPDGSRAWLLTNEQLTPDDGDTGFDLYEWHAADGSVERVSSGASGSVQEANVVPRGVRSSDDGSVVYFGAQGKGLAPGAPDLEAWGPTENIYARTGSATKFVATLPAFELPTPPRCLGSSWRLTPDGRHLLIGTTASLLPADTDGSRDIYEYSLDSEGLTLLTQGAKGGNGSFDAELGISWDNCGSPPYNETQSMSDDGRYVAFSTEEGLDNEDVNGRRDVYLHDLTSGRTSLVSTGTSTNVSSLIGIGASGRDILFSTFDALVPQDRDTAQDIYDARIGGGFPLPASRECSGDECQGALGASPVPSQPASAVLSGKGNLHRKACRGRKSHRKRCGRHRHKRHTRPNARHQGRNN